MNENKLLNYTHKKIFRRQQTLYFISLFKKYLVAEGKFSSGDLHQAREGFEQGPSR